MGDMQPDSTLLSTRSQALEAMLKDTSPELPSLGGYEPALLVRQQGQSIQLNDERTWCLIRPCCPDLRHRQRNGKCSVHVAHDTKAMEHGASNVL